MTFRLTTKKYDALYTRAREARMNLSEFVRTRLEPAGGKIRPLQLGGPIRRS